MRMLVAWVAFTATCAVILGSKAWLVARYVHTHTEEEQA